ncbi:hypothetical protein AS159_08355 [Thermotoga sp. Ku-13t]|uniref:energy-coupling factor transporter transmembrane component T family protein n=1 Tax=Thermotoga sp. Ku-13t TaxID=1755813 RepID=UPI0013E9A8A6|nr:energy-coupling factor transporter transmembrane component T [Thermotoga sp. Ku-13t]KAF2957662.1 hypothetical protein AS159_08355 [Thermotoga sp. Ku-13t]
MNDFGKYIHRDSLVHRMNPVLKIVYLVVILSLGFASGSTLYFITSFATVFILMLLSKIRLKVYLLDLLKLKWFLITIFLIQILPLTKTRFSLLLIRALSSTYVVALSVLVTFLIFRTTTNITIAKAFEVILRSLGMKKLARKVSLLLTLSLIQIPIIFEQMERIRIAQTLRGQTWKTKNPLKALKSLESIIVPLLFFTLRRAESISVSLQMRKYDAHNRPTLYKPLNFSHCDLLLILLIVSLFLSLVR